MKILFCSNEQLLPLLGGGSAGNLRIVEKMVERGHSLTVVTPLFIDKEPIESKYGITLKPCSPFYMHRTARWREVRYPAYIFIYATHIFRILLKERFDLIFVRNCTLGFLLIPIARLFKIPISISMTDFITGFLYEDERYPAWLIDLLVNAEKSVARAAGKTFVITPQMKRTLLESHPLDDNRVCVSYDGVDSGLFNPGTVQKADIERIHERIGFRDRIVMFHGVIDPYHGLHTMQSIMEKTFAKTDANFLIIACGEGFKQLRRQITSPRVAFLDFVPYEEVPRFIAAAHVGLIPYKPTYTLNQVFTLKFLEYTSMGLPTVLFRLKSVEELFGQYAFPFFSDDIETFCDNIARALEQPKSEEAVKIIQEQYSWDVVTTRIVKELEEWVASQR